MEGLEDRWVGWRISRVMGGRKGKRVREVQGLSIRNAPVVEKRKGQITVAGREDD
jgi:hypothetical protein